MTKSAFAIDIQPQQLRWKTAIRPYCKTVRTAVEAALMGAKLKAAEVTVVLADDAFIRRLNHQYRGQDKATNVLSFPNDEFSRGQPHLGDLVLALETFEREAKEQGKTLHAHVTHLLVHGTLHLLGHDHEEEGQAEAMEAIEIKILKKLGVANPYL